MSANNLTEAVKAAIESTTTLEGLAEALREIMAHDDFGMDAKVVAKARQALAQHEAGKQEPVAWMWQHDETGRTGFVAGDFDRKHWEENNPRLHIVGPCYSAPTDSEWNRLHHVLKRYGLHPGRTNDNIIDIVDAALSAPPNRADAARYRWLANNLKWSIAYRCKGNNRPMEYRMRDEGEYWGHWWLSVNEAVDAAKEAKP